VSSGVFPPKELISYRARICIGLCLLSQVKDDGKETILRGKTTILVDDLSAFDRRSSCCI
jgi:hypothetical protein